MEGTPKKKVVIVGTAYPYRGGLATYNERLAREFMSRGYEVTIETFSLQYPSFLFPGKTQFSESPAPEDLSITRSVNSINPFTWLKVGRKIRRMQPDLVVIKYWLPYMAPALGTIARLARHGKTKVVTILDNMIPHEKRPGDMMFSRYYCGSVDGFVAMSESVLKDVDIFDTKKPRTLQLHPLYDNFGPAVSKEEACAKLGLDPSFRYLLFFGLIRDYKGLDWLLEAISDERIRSAKDVKLIVAGEFYSHPEKYEELVKTLGLESQIVWKTEFVPDELVRYYFCASELVVQPYKSATQSGVTQIAYHFSKPMLVTDVGGLSEIVPDGECGYVVKPEVSAIADALVRHISTPSDFAAGIEAAKKKYSWSAMCGAIEKIADDCKK